MYRCTVQKRERLLKRSKSGREIGFFHLTVQRLDVLLNSGQRGRAVAHESPEIVNVLNFCRFTRHERVGVLSSREREGFGRGPTRYWRRGRWPFFPPRRRRKRARRLCPRTRMPSSR